MKPPHPVPPEATVNAHPGRVSIEFTVDPSFRYLDGHFEGNPIVPAIAQIGWMLASVEILHGARPVVYSLNRYKFKRAIRPGDPVCLIAEGDGGRFKTTVSVDGVVAASGNLIVEASDV